MIRNIASFDECCAFVNDFYKDPQFSDPMLQNEEQLKWNLCKRIDAPGDDLASGVYEGEKLIGIFVFLREKEQMYLEMLVGLSREKAAYEQILAYLQDNYPNNRVDFVFNPNNHLLKELLMEKKADFYPEQQKMVLKAFVPGSDTSGVQLLSPNNVQAYFDIHNQDMYWTGEKVAAAQDRFRTFLAIDQGKVVGYLDVTYTFDENEPFDLLVLPEYRRKGWGRKLLAKALEMNEPKGMMLLVNVDNEPAIKLYSSMGFEKEEGSNSLLAQWNVQEKPNGYIAKNE